MFLRILQAAQAYDAAARSIRGDTAVCNFPLAEGQTAPAPQRYSFALLQLCHYIALSESCD